MSSPVTILCVIIAYFAVWLAVSSISSRGADNSTFFTGNRKMPWPLVAIAMLGAPISGVTFISVPGMVIHKSFSYLQMCMGFFIGYLVIAYVLVPLYYRLNIISIYEFLKRRFGQSSYKTGAWLFFVSKLLGISVRFLVICAMLQLVVFDPLGIPYIASVLLSLSLVWLSTYKGGVKSVIWGDVLKSICLLSTIMICLYFVGVSMRFSPLEMIREISFNESSRIFFFDDPADGKYFWKQFIAGIFLVIAMTGLDQDMMQRTLACKNANEARKNLITGSLLQTLVITLLLFLGASMITYLQSRGEAIPDKSDNLFATVAFNGILPLAVGILFIIGLISATFSSVASAVTSLTTTMTIDILNENRDGGEGNLKMRRISVHTGISLAMALLVIAFFYLNNDDAISMVYTLVSYTDGPILGLFLFGILTKRMVNEKMLPLACIMAPVISWAIQRGILYYFDYNIGFELLLLNAGLTYAGLYILSLSRRVYFVSPAGKP